MITGTDIKNYIFCPRILFFKKIHKFQEPWKNNFLIQEGLKKHRERYFGTKYIYKFLQGFLDRRIEVKLFSENMMGVIDEIYIYEDEIIPIEYKNSEFLGIISDCNLFQLIFYALLLKKNYDKKIKKGYLIYLKGKREIIEIIFEEIDFINCEEEIKKILNIIETESMPLDLEIDNHKCKSCEFKRICKL